MNLTYSKLCPHSRLSRVDSNFVRCQQCGLSIINQTNVLKNKTGLDFANENVSFTRNFDRNFSNVLEEVEKSLPVYDYYYDINKVNKIIVNRQVQFSSYPEKYHVKINDRTCHLTKEEINKILLDTKAVYKGSISQKKMKNNISI